MKATNMRVIGSVSNKVWLGLAIASLALTGCSAMNTNEPVRELKIQQTWELEPGDEVAGYRIAGSLGDISIDLNGGTVYAPFNGRVQPNNLEGCLVYSTPEIPAYVFRLCGVRPLNLGEIRQGTPIAKGDYLEFATLRRQPEGTWTMVEPAQDILERALAKP